MQRSLRDAPRNSSLLTALLVLAGTACGVGAVDNAALLQNNTNASQAASQSAGGGAPATTNPATSNPTASPGPTPAVSPVATTPNTTTPTATTPNTTTPTAAPATFTGTVQQTALVPASAIFAVVTASDGSQTLAVKLSDQADDCAEVTNNAHHANSNSFWLRADGSTFANAAFQLSGENSDSSASTATFYALDNTCSDTLADTASWATSGKVTFAAVSAQTASGTFNAAIGAQSDQVSGSFTATVCPALATLITAPDTMRTCE